MGGREGDSMTPYRPPGRPADGDRHRMPRSLRLTYRPAWPSTTWSRTSEDVAPKLIDLRVRRRRSAGCPPVEAPRRRASSLPCPGSCAVAASLSHRERRDATLGPIAQQFLDFPKALHQRSILLWECPCCVEIQSFAIGARSFLELGDLGTPHEQARLGYIETAQHHLRPRMTRR